MSDEEEITFADAINSILRTMLIVIFRIVQREMTIGEAFTICRYLEIGVFLTPEAIDKLRKRKKEIQLEVGGTQSVAIPDWKGAEKGGHVLIGPEASETVRLHERGHVECGHVSPGSWARFTPNIIAEIQASRYATERGAEPEELLKFLGTYVEGSWAEGWLDAPTAAALLGAPEAELEKGLAEAGLEVYIESESSMECVVNWNEKWEEEFGDPVEVVEDTTDGWWFIKDKVIQAAEVLSDEDKLKEAFGETREEFEKEC